MGNPPTQPSNPTFGALSRPHRHGTSWLPRRAAIPHYHDNPLGMSLSPRPTKIISRRCFSGQSATRRQGFVLDKSATDQFPTSGGLTVVPKGGVPQSMTQPPPMVSRSPHEQLTAQRDPDGLVPKHCGVTAFSGHNDFCDDNLPAI